MHLPFVHVTAEGGSHGGMVTLQPWLVNCLHCFWFALSCATLNAVSPAMLIAMLHESKHEAESSMLLQSLVFVHERLESTAATTSA